MKRTTWRLERVYRRSQAGSDYRAWKTQLCNQRSLYQTKYSTYWSSAIAECRGDGKQLWSKLKLLMNPPSTSQSSGFTADDLATFFVRKVADIRAATASSPPANIQLRDTTPFGTLDRACHCQRSIQAALFNASKELPARPNPHPASEAISRHICPSHGISL